MKKERGGLFITDQYAAYFVTFTIVGWVDLFTRKECRNIVMDAFKYCQENKGLVVHAYVIMSNHIHAILRAKEDSEGLSGIIRDYKKYTSKKMFDWIMTSGKESRKDWLEIVFKYHGKYNPNNKTIQIWIQDNCPKILLHPRFINRKLNYIHNNPVEAEIVEKPEDYLHSSARNYMNVEPNLLEVNIIHFGTQQGYIYT